MKIRKTTAILAIGMMVLLIATGFSRQNDQSTANNLQTIDGNIRTVTVSGTGEMTTPSDMAIVRLGVQTSAETAQEALDDNSQQVQSLLQVLRDAGINSSDIETQSINLNPRYDREQDSPEVSSFEASNIIMVKVREIDSLGEILDAAVEAGSNAIQGIHFQASDSADLVEQARSLAVENAQEKAEQLVDLVDAQLGSVLTVEETSSTPVTPAPREVEFAQADTAVPVEPGSQTIQVHVRITWEMDVDDQTGINAGSPNVIVAPPSGAAGSDVSVEAEGFPINTEVELGVGRWRSEYDVIGTATTSPQGTLDTEVTIPDFAEISEQWVVVVATTSGKEILETSNIFLVNSG
jgi:uncharacterized protein YggE